MSSLCIPLADTTPLLNADYVHPHFDERKHINLDLKRDVNPYWGKLMESHNLILNRVELFYGPENFPYTMGIHIDSGLGDKGKINWVYGGEGCEMHWYRIVSLKDKPALKTPVGSSYNLYDPDEVQLIHTNTIKNPTLVQVGIPHNIVNPGKERWCYSMVILDPATKTNVSFGKLKRVFGV